MGDTDTGVPVFRGRGRFMRDSRIRESPCFPRSGAGLWETHRHRRVPVFRAPPGDSDRGCSMQAC